MLLFKTLKTEFSHNFQKKKDKSLNPTPTIHSFTKHYTLSL